MVGSRKQCINLSFTRNPVQECLDSSNHENLLAGALQNDSCIQRFKLCSLVGECWKLNDVLFMGYVRLVLTSVKLFCMRNTECSLSPYVKESVVQNVSRGEHTLFQEISVCFIGKVVLQTWQNVITSALLSPFLLYQTIAVPLLFSEKHKDI